MARLRLDTLLTDRGLFESRSRAAASVMAGEVRVGPDRRRAEKPGQMVDEKVLLEVVDRQPYVSRGGIKLVNALTSLGLEVGDRRALDVGASTGGFTDCLLQRGAAAVIALDVAYGELSWRLREDPRVIVMERVNARAIAPADLPYRPDLIVADVSFISLTKVLPAVLAAASPEGYDCLAMVKPQFEVGRARIGSGGVVRDPEARRDALRSVARTAVELGASVQGFASSGLPGPKGNRETFIWIGPGARGDGVDIEAALAGVEP